MFKENMLKGQGMNLVRVEKQELLNKLKQNKRDHHNTFLEALDGYHKAAQKELADRVEKAKKNKRVSLLFHLMQPQDQTKEYSRIIAMLEMDTRDQVELTQREFANYVMDDWDWTQSFLASSSVYSVSARNKLADYDN